MDDLVPVAPPPPAEVAYLDDNYVFYGGLANEAANAPANLRSQETNKFKSNMLDKTGLSVQAFEHSRATIAGVEGKNFALARDRIFQSMVDEISAQGVQYMNQLIGRATAQALGNRLSNVAIDPRRIPRSLAQAFAENYVRAVSQQLLDDLELLFPSDYVNYSILNIKRGDEAERPVIPRP